MRKLLNLIAICILTTHILLAEPSTSKGSPISASVNDQLIQAAAKHPQESPQVWLVTRAEYTGPAHNRLDYAAGLGLKFKRHNYRLMYWPYEQKIRLDFQVRVD
jgi:hypothetical protein